MAGTKPSVFVVPSAPRLLWRSAHESRVTAVSLRPDGVQAVSGGGDGALCAWDAETGNPLWRIGDVMAFGPEGKKLIVGSPDFGVRLFAVDEGDRVPAAFTAIGPVCVDREEASRLFR